MTLRLLGTFTQDVPRHAGQVRCHIASTLYYYKKNRYHHVSYNESVMELFAANSRQGDELSETGT